MRLIVAAGWRDRMKNSDGMRDLESLCWTLYKPHLESSSTSSTLLDHSYKKNKLIISTICLSHIFYAILVNNFRRVMFPSAIKFN